MYLQLKFPDKAIFVLISTLWNHTQRNLWNQFRKSRNSIRCTEQCRRCCLYPGFVVMVCNYCDTSRWIHGAVLKKLRPISNSVDAVKGGDQVLKCHIDQLLQCPECSQQIQLLETIFMGSPITHHLSYPDTQDTTATVLILNPACCEASLQCTHYLINIHQSVLLSITDFWTTPGKAGGNAVTFYVVTFMSSLLLCFLC